MDITIPFGELRDGNLAQRLGWCRDLRVGMIRTDAYYQDRADGWADLDRVVDAIIAVGIKPMLVLTGPWAVGWRSYLGTAAQRRDFATWGGSVAKRYAGRGGHIQVGNEPNVQGMPAQVYVDLLSRTAAKVRAAAPKTKVISAGITPVPEASGDRIPSLVYLPQLYAAGFKGVADVYAAHYYSKGLLPSAPDWWGGWRILMQQRAIMAEHGDSPPVWITEFGVSTGGPTPATEQAQVDVLRDALRIRPAWVKRIMWHTLKDRPDWATVTDGGFGAYRADGSPKPVTAVIKSI